LEGWQGWWCFAICSLFLFQKVEAPARSPPVSQKTIVFGVCCPQRWRSEGNHTELYSAT
jgi:hypothetical protein